MKVQEHFINVFSYAAGVDKWCKDAYAENGKGLAYTFCNDFAIADWYGEQNVRSTYERVKEHWLSDYKAFTEVVVSLNMLAWANDQLSIQGFEDRIRYVELYSELYEEARDLFYETYGENKEASSYFFDMTD